MEIKELRCFTRVATTLNFNRAAEQLNMSQPVVTKVVAQLEHKLGVKLFERTTRRVALTSAGALLYRESEGLLEHLDQVRRAIRHEIGEQSGRFAIGVTTLAMQTVFPQVMRDFRSRHPAIDVTIHELPTDAQLKSLRSAEIDAGFLLAPASDPMLEVYVVHEQVMRLALPSDHILLRHFDSGSLSLSAFTSDTFIIPSKHKHPAIHDEIIRACSTAGFRPRVQECQENQSCISLVEAGIGVTFVTGHMIATDEKKMRVIELHAPVPTLNVALAWRRDDRSPLLTTIRELSVSEANRD
ncbi:MULTISPECIES: LysR family transcriptional regulator [Hyphomicrobiales]|uniref:LysR family transcriptional regulator n=2 Tax=Hyphomicrobiales TaxID=356 RepID=A0A6L3Y8X2_9HYPH|nr:MULTISPECIES: LysR family transcriptional regulator [Hyphomicrobiales]KAB2678434.1 LysR family transcriptional regulator [Brucella tritici]MBO0130456.1 LysR family transcriptional regulator [Agrobacterium burrii]